MAERLSVAAAAARAGVATKTWTAYIARGQAPDADGRDEIFGRKYWLDTTIDAWLRDRPGRGARTDLR